MKPEFTGPDEPPSRRKPSRREVLSSPVKKAIKPPFAQPKENLSTSEHFILKEKSKMPFDTFITFTESQEEAQRLLHAKEGIQNLYTEITKKTGPLDMIVYPASGGDAFPISVTPTLVMIDEARFAGEESYFLEGIMKANENPSQAFSFKDSLEDPEIVEATKTNLERMQGEASQEINKYALMGHHCMYTSISSDSIMRSLYAMGVNPLAITIQSREDGFKLSFELDGQPKQIYYKSMKLPSNNSLDKSYDPIIRFISQVAEENDIQRTGVLVKADMEITSLGIIRGYQPDVLIYDMDSLLHEAPMRLEEFNKTFRMYDRTLLGGDADRYNDIKFGYTDSPTQIVVATRKKRS